MTLSFPNNPVLIVVCASLFFIWPLDDVGEEMKTIYLSQESRETAILMCEGCLEQLLTQLQDLNREEAIAAVEMIRKVKKLLEELK